MILPDDLRLEAEGDAIIFDGYCFSPEGGQSSCLTEFNAFNELGLDELGLVVVQEDGGWLFSPFETVEIVLSTAAEHYLELRDAGELDKLLQE